MSLRSSRHPETELGSGSENGSEKNASFEHHTLNRPCRGELVSGDTAIVRELQNGLFLGLADVLGHGVEAHAVAKRIKAYLEKAGSNQLAHLFYELDAMLKGTRGAAISMAWVERSSGALIYAGIGNVVLKRLGRKPVQLVSRDGTVGLYMRTPLVQKARLDEGEVLVMHSDGVRGRFGTDDYPQIGIHDTRTVASNVIERFGKDQDDASCIIVKYRA